MAVDAYTADLLDLLAIDPLHDRSRAEVERAIWSVAVDYDGRIDPNEVRRRLPAWVRPQQVGPTYRAMVLRGDIEPSGWTTSDDAKGRNSGKPARTYRVVAEADKEVPF
jgi:hypothetical protein